MSEVLSELIDTIVPDTDDEIPPSLSEGTDTDADFEFDDGWVVQGRTIPPSSETFSGAEVVQECRSEKHELNPFETLKPEGDQGDVDVCELVAEVPVEKGERRN